ncbi:MAG: sigma-54 dependent transcriptional regulator [bacterium]|nr:sigma-54 dependent transcriptional regulator [bacterium]
MEVLIVEDDENYRFEIEQELAGYFEAYVNFHYANCLQEAQEIIENSKFSIQLMLIDIIFPLTKKDVLSEKVDYRAGVKLLDFARDSGYSGNIVVLSSQDKSFAVDLLIQYKNVTDYVFKDSAWREIRKKVEKQIEVLQTKQSLLNELRKRDFLVGGSDVIDKIKRMSVKVANVDTTILITGESGVGKEVAARYFHEHSSRCLAPFEVVNCAAVPEGLFESLLFGHKKGSFTGADEDQIGSFERAHGGTIFLDEIGELPLLMQGKLLRVLQEKTIQPVGSQQQVTVDVRVITATNRSLEEAVLNKQFREDLYYRINVLPLELPPLRERRADISPLIKYFLSLFQQRTGLEKDIEVKAMNHLENFKWPGNVRELKNSIERLVILSDGDQITYDDVVSILQFTEEEDYRVHFPADEVSYKEVKQRLIDAFHKRFFSHHLKLNDYQISKTAQLTGYNRNDLSAIIKKLGLSKCDS